MNGGGRRGGGPSIAPHRLLGDLAARAGRGDGPPARRRPDGSPAGNGRHVTGAAERPRPRGRAAAGLRTATAPVARPPMPLQAPRPLVVGAAAGPEGPVPRWVVWRGRQRRIAAIDDEWRVDDEWWRDEISRHYFVVRLEDDRRLTLFLDRIHGTWWQHA